jgi:beta-glucanase (GH16 family)
MFFVLCHPPAMCAAYRMKNGFHGLVAGSLTLCALNTSAERIPTADVEAYPGYTGEYPGFTLLLDDRFDRFEEDVWKKGDGAVGAEAACRFQDQGVQVVDGLLELVVRREDVKLGWSEDHQQTKNAYQYSCGEMRTRPERRIRYGRVETRMRAPHRQVASGYISSLFTYTNETNGAGRAEWEEIDIELEGKRFLPAPDPAGCIAT